MKNIIYFYYAVFFGAIGLIAADIFIPSMSSIATHFNVDISIIQSSIAVFMLGFSLARFFISIISDGLGRKLMFILCFTLLSIGSAICLFSTNEYMFISGRLLQGIGAGGSNVLARVIIRDITDNANLAKFNSLYSMYAITLMVAAPFLGSILQTYFDWDAVFLVLTILGTLALFVSILSYQETNAHKNIAHLQPSKIKANFLELIKSEASFKYASLLFVSFGFMTAWLTSGSVILQDQMKLTYIEFGECALFVGFFYFMSSYLSSKYVKRLGERYLILLGSRLFIFSPLILSAAFLVEHTYATAFIIVLAVAIGFSAAGLIIPNAYSLGVKSSIKIAGMAGAFFGFAQMFGGCIYSYFISLTNSYSIIPLLMTMMATLMIVLFSTNDFKEKSNGQYQYND